MKEFFEGVVVTKTEAEDKYGNIKTTIEVFGDGQIVSVVLAGVRDYEIGDVSAVCLSVGEVFPTTTTTTT
jgi:hypothetical protein